MSLSDLPDDILNLISCLLNGFDNCSLWMASDSKLKQRLVDNVITDFYIQCKTPGRHLWPGNFLKRLQRLSRLSLVVDRFQLPLDNVQLFPIKTLKDLDLRCSGRVLQRIRDPAEVASSRQIKYINVNDFYPSLEHLTIFDPMYIPDPHFFRCLPQNLKTLSIPSFKIDPNYQNNINLYTSSLPRSLTVLNLRLPFDDRCFDASTLPPNLTSLTTNLKITEGSYSDIPQTIQHLYLSFVEYDIQKLSPFLPAGLESISIDLQSDCLLGPTLSNLKNLKHIEILSRGNPFMSTTSEKLKSFPDGLAELIVGVEEGIDRDFFVMLPQSVTNLCVNCPQYPEDLKFFDLLPKSLQSFETNLPINDPLSLIPSSITKLLLCPQEEPIIDYIDLLPPKLESLALRGVDCLDSMLKVLPESLTSLELLAPCIVVDDETIQCLPRGLKSLSLETFAGDFDPPFMTDPSKLPPNLETLHLFGDDRITDDAIAKLPRSLTSLRLEKNDRLTNKSIKDMPPKLIELALPACKGITLSCFQDLPKHLSSLVVLALIIGVWIQRDICPSTASLFHNIN